MKQIKFLEAIIDAFIENGIVEADQLFESPFTDFHSAGILGLFDEEKAYKIVSLVEEVNQNAVG